MFAVVLGMCALLSVPKLLGQQNLRLLEQEAKVFLVVPRGDSEIHHLSPELKVHGYGRNHTLYGILIRSIYSLWRVLQAAAT